MARVKRGIIHNKKRKGILKRAKGFSAGRKNILRQATQATKKAGQRAYDHRKLKKRQMRGLWQIKISAGVQAHGINYSGFMGALKKKNIELDRKVLAGLAEHHPEAFAKVVEATK